ncbi:MAG: DNA alkylation repair protein [Akkermansia sp.]|nr:DNA alkylation repair protein [Akkermansia sp.]
MERREIQARLREMAEPAYARFAEKLLPDNTHPLLGVRLPRLRRLARAIARSGDAPALLRRLPGKRAAFEEIMLCGMLPGYMDSLPFTARTRCIDRLAPRLDNWSLVDSCCATYSFAAAAREQAWEWLLPYTRHPQEYMRRFGTVMLLDHFVKDPAWAARVAGVLPGIRPGAYYSDMAVAWCACEICLRHPALHDSLAAALPEPLLRLTRRKLRESRRC